MASQPLKIDITVDDKGTATLKSFGDTASREFKRAESAGQDMGKNLGSSLGVLKNGYIAAAASIGAALYGINKAWDLAKIGADYEEQRGILNNLSKKYSTSSEEIVTAMRKASDELIADSDLMSVALGGIAKGLKPEQLINLADAARILGDAAGKDATTALKDLTQALETGRVKGLKSYLGTAIDLEKSFGDLTQKMTEAEKAQGLYSIVMIEASKLQAQQGAEVDSAADKLERLDAQYKNITLDMAIFAKQVVVGFIDAAKSSIKYGALMVDAMGGMSAASDVSTAAVNKEADARKNSLAPYEQQIETLKKLLATRADHTKSLKDGEAAAKKAASEIANAEKQIADATRKSAIEIEGYGQTQYEKDLIRIAAEEQKWLDLRVSEVSIAKWKAAEITIAEQKMYDETTKQAQDSFDDWRKRENEKTDQAKKNAAEKTKAERNLYADLRGYEGEFYRESLKLIDEQAKRYRELGIDQNAIAKWVKEEYLNAEIQKGEASDDFFEGISAGYKRMEKEQVGWGEVGSRVFASMLSEMTSTFSNVFEDAYKGKLKSLSDYSTAIWDGVRKAFFDVIAKMAAQKVMMYFETAWTSGGASVLSMLSQIAGFAFAGNEMEGSVGEGMMNVEGSAVPYSSGGPVSGMVFTGGGTGRDMAMAYGGTVDGKIPGSAPYHGDHPGNDIVPIWASPGEVVIRRSSVNTETAELLDYINKRGRVPWDQYYSGGAIAGMVTGQPYRGYFGWDDVTSVLTGGLSDVLEGHAPGYRIAQGLRNLGVSVLGVDVEDYGIVDLETYLKDLHTTLKSGASPEEGIANFIDAIADPTRRVNISLEKIGEQLPDDLVAIAPQLGAIIGTAINAVGGTAIGYGIGAHMQGQSSIEAQLGAGTAAAASYTSSAVGGYVAGETGSLIAGRIAGAVAASLVRMGINTIAASYLADALLSAKMNIKFDGLSGAGGMINTLSDWASATAPKSYAFSAREGLDYVPRDNFIVNAHEGEAVLNKKEARGWRRSQEGSPVTINFNIGGNLIGDKGTFNDFVAKIDYALNKRSKREYGI
jgi:hypothetical protein